MKKIWQYITALKNATGNVIFIAVIGLIVFAVFSQESSSVPDSAVMILDPEGIIVEQVRMIDPVEQYLSGENENDPETLGRDLIDAILLATEDDRIKAIALDLSKLRGSTLPQYDDIGRALELFKATEKPVYAFGTSYTQSQYYLASFADKIYIDKHSLPALGGVFLQGFGTYPLYLKSALDKLHVSMHVIKAGTYKDAAEMFQRDDMSDHSREANQELVDFLWGSYLATIANHREMPIDAISDYISDYGALLEANDSDPARLAVVTGLVDDLISRSDWREEMKALSGESGDTYNHIDYRRYLAAEKSPIAAINPASDKIAVIIAKGNILDGEQPPGEIGGDSIARLIRQARNSNSIKAIVIRIDSPGGSSSASELIRSELAATQESGKPVVASMGGYAASGGYWIASTANKIFAAETTITGSIGVFTLFPTFENSIDQLGIHSDGVGTTPLSGAFNSFAKLNPLFEKTLQSSVDRTYLRFLHLVSEGRGLSIEEADSVAQGRVWSGTRALENGLIDAIGDTQAAIQSAAILADISDYDVIYLEKELSPKDQLIRQLLRSSVSIMPSLPVGLVSIVPTELRTLAKMVQAPALYLQCTNCRITF